jgi:MSHA pilin protein MshC
MKRLRNHRATRPQGRVFARRPGEAGYTAVELVVVMVLVGILAANALPRFVSASRFEAMGFQDAVVNALRYAQKIALASRCDTRVQIGASGYAIWQRAAGCTSGAFTRPVTRPGAGNWSASTPAGVAVGTLDLFFDARGRPHDVASGAVYTAPQAVTVGARTVTVESVTGYTHSS